MHTILPRILFGFVAVLTATTVVTPVSSTFRQAPAVKYDNVSLILENASVVTAWDFVERARTAAAENRHRDAVGWYLGAVTHHPPLGDRVARELGYLFNCIGQPDSAITWYDAFLSHNPGDVEAHLAIAHALSWSDRPDDALDHYRLARSLCDDQLPEIELGIARATLRKDELARE